MQVTEPTTITLNDLEFKAVHLEHARFDHKNAVYAVLELEEDGEFCVLDVGESNAAGESTIHPDQRRTVWEKRAKAGNLWVGTYLVPVEMLFAESRNPTEHRASIVAQLRQQYRVPRD